MLAILHPLVAWFNSNGWNYSYVQINVIFLPQSRHLLYLVTIPAASRRVAFARSRVELHRGHRGNRTEIIAAISFFIAVGRQVPTGRCHSRFAAHRHFHKAASALADPSSGENAVWTTARAS
jgi:hypothetical protein